MGFSKIFVTFALQLLLHKIRQIKFNPVITFISMIIPIPSINKESRIGKALNIMFHVIDKTEAADYSEDVIWDFSKCSFLHPFLIGGLCVYRLKSDRTIKLQGLTGYTQRYLSLIHFDESLELPNADAAEALMTEYGSKSYIPICRFRTEDDETIDSITAALQKIIQRQANLPARFTSALSYLLSELTANIHDHSRSFYGYMFSQYLAREGCINLCIIDNGISIAGSFQSSPKYDDKLLGNEGEILNMALSHCSTKNLPDQENRGFGLPTTKKMLAEGMKGSFLIVSGNAFHRHDPHGQQTVELQQGLGWDGTFVLLKIPVSLPDNFNYLNYADRL